MKHRSLLLGGLAALALLGGCKAETKSTAEPIRPVRTITAAVETAVVAIRLPGEVKPRHETRAGFRVAGKIMSREVEVGDTVRAGQVLAALEPADFKLATQAQQAAVQAARTDLRLASIELERVTSLRRNDFSTKAEFDRRKAAEDAARAKLANAEAQLGQIRNQAAYATLVADFDAVVTAVEAEVGQVVATGQPVVRLARPEEKEVLVAVPEARLREVRDAPSFEITVAALPGRRWTGALRELSPLADPVTRTFAARISVPPAEDAPALGMSATLAVPVAVPPRILVPLSAIHTRDDQPGVWVVEGSPPTARRLAVETAGVEGNAVRVVGGLAGGETVIVAGANLIRAGQTVRLLEGER